MKVSKMRVSKYIPHKCVVFSPLPSEVSSIARYRVRVDTAIAIRTSVHPAHTLSVK